MKKEGKDGSMNGWKKYYTENNGAAPFTLWDQEEGGKCDVQVRCESDLTTTEFSQLCQSVDFFDVINLG